MLNKFPPAAGPFYQNTGLDGGAKIKRRRGVWSKLALAAQHIACPILVEQQGLGRIAALPMRAAGVLAGAGYVCLADKSLHANAEGHP